MDSHKIRRPFSEPLGVLQVVGKAHKRSVSLSPLPLSSAKSNNPAGQQGVSYPPSVRLVELQVAHFGMKDRRLGLPNDAEGFQTAKLNIWVEVGIRCHEFSWNETEIHWATCLGRRLWRAGVCHPVLWPTAEFPRESFFLVLFPYILCFCRFAFFPKIKTFSTSFLNLFYAVWETYTYILLLGAVG